MQTGATRYGTQTAVEYQAPLTSDDIPFPLNEAKRRREGSTLKIRDSRLETPPRGIQSLNHKVAGPVPRGLFCTDKHYDGFFRHNPYSNWST